MRRQFDLIVVGAGPGGSNAAAFALDGGLKVAQIDKASFPRTKPCAGAITPKGLNALRLDARDSVRQTFSEFQFNAFRSRSNHFGHHRTILTMVFRSEFDNRLVSQNLARENFRFFDSEPVIDVRWSGEVFEVITKKRRLWAPQLVGADGAYSVVNRIFGVSVPKARATAVEVCLKRDLATLQKPCPPCFDWGAISRGYGWVFPKDDHWSVGLYTLDSEVRRFKDKLTNYIGTKGFQVEGDALATFASHQLPVGGFRLRAPSVPVYIVGDAGGFADAISGEGISYALESGRLAGKVAARVHSGRGSQRAYYRRLWRSVLPDTALSYYLSQVVYRNESRALRILESPFLWRPLVQGSADGATLTKCLVLSGLYMLRSLKTASLKKAGA